MRFTPRCTARRILAFSEVDLMGSVFVKQWNIFVPQQVTSCILLPSAQSLNAAKVNLMMNYGRRVLV
jgi:hypothetical protein